MNGYMFDTNIFNRILDAQIDVKLPESEKYFATHIQLDELNQTPDANIERRKQLLAVFRKVEPTNLLTESIMLDVSRLELAKLGDGQLANEIRASLESKKKRRSNNQDALIAETSIRNDLILVTDDKNLLKTVGEFGGAAITWVQFQQRILDKPSEV